MSVQELIENLRRSNIGIELVGDQLKLIHQDSYAIDEDMLQEVNQNKSAIIDFIRTAREQKGNFSSIPKTKENESSYEISHAQKRLLILAQFEESLVAYNSFAVKTLEGRLDLQALQRAFYLLIERHESLRTVFFTLHGEYRQKIVECRPEDFQIEFADLTAQPFRTDRVVEYCRNYCQIVFDLQRLPLIKTGILKTDDDEFIFLCTIHHIISDGWSLKVFFSELIQLYNSFTSGTRNNLPPLGIQYKDFSIWQNRLLSDNDIIQPYKKYWVDKFSDLPILFDLALDFKRPPVKTYHGKKSVWVLPDGIAMIIQNISKKNKVSLFVVLLSVVKLLLFKYSNAEDITIGTSVAGRDHPDLENQIGFYVNSLALRTKFSRDDSFEIFLQKVKATVLDGLENQMYPFDCLVDDLQLKRDFSHSPLFDVKVVLQSTENLEVIRNVKQDNSLNGIIVKDYFFEQGISIYDLSFRFTERSRNISLEIEFNTDLFYPKRIEQMCNHLLVIIGAIGKDTGILLEQVEYITEEEKKTILNRYVKYSIGNRHV